MNDSFHCNFPFDSYLYRILVLIYLFLFPLNSADGGKIIQWMILEVHEMKDLIFELLAHSF